MRVVMHGHHADALFSTFDNEMGVKERREFIATRKPKKGRALRLALFKDVTDLLPKNKELNPFKARDALYAAQHALYKAWGAYAKANDPLKRAAYDKAWYARNEARSTYAWTWGDYLESFDVNAFHKEHCHPNCPWDGITIFSKGTSSKVLKDDNHV